MDYKDPHERNSLCAATPPPSLSCSILILVPVFPGMEPCPGRQHISHMSLSGLPCYRPFRFRPLHPPTVAGDRTSPAPVDIFKLAAQLFSDHYFGFSCSQVHYLLSLFLPSLFSFSSYRNAVLVEVFGLPHLLYFGVYRVTLSPTFIGIVWVILVLLFSWF